MPAPATARRTRPARTLAAVATALALAGCSGGDDGAGAGDPASSSALAGDPAPVPEPPAPPEPGACYRLGFDEALAPTTSSTPVGCSRPHSAETYAVGELDSVVDGHLLAVDSDHVQEQVAGRCPERLPRFLGGSQDQLRLTMLRAVWFTPTVEESDAGADWFRCDVIAVATDGRLARLTEPARGLLADPERRAAYGMCATAEPGTSDFRRVICSAEHAWRAVATVPFEDESYPGPDEASARGETPCEDAGRAAAEDPLDFRWGYEWPTAEQWAAGQTWGLCWVPD
ncbi:septum formation family protein [Nocardioides ferulae]|uniref:septum formation family protein n=1 Tax=Nocardioides ferulae TaxID=2340821 RepID=UPI000EAD056A|nr:septum formation family protein [Nocardioides ferulae]